VRRQLLTVCVVVGLTACGPDLGLAPGAGAGRYLIELRSDPSSLGAAPALVLGQGGTLAGEKAEVLRGISGLTLVEALDFLPMLVVDVAGSAELQALSTHPLVVQVWEDSAYPLADALSFPYIGEPAAVAAGITGAGTTVAVLDTGLDYTRAAFGTCATPGATGCRVAYVQDFAPTDNQLDDNGHGTNVAGIIAGLAPGARLVGLDVFTGASAYASDIISAINWVVANKARYNLVALNLSLGGGASTSPCASDVFASPISVARAAGVLSVVAAGNGALTSSLASPACAPEAISVGALYDAPVGGVGYGVCTDATTAAGQVACFSNSAPFLSLLAPGAFINAAGSTMTGTSQAAPHVAGALALLASKYPADSANTRASRLLAGAPTVRDARNGVTRPRLSLGAAPGACPVTVTPETASLAETGGTLSFAVAAPAGCAWTVTGAPAWLPPSATSGVARATLTVKVAANSGAPRTDVFQVAGVVVRVTQAADTTPPSGTVSLPAVTRVPQVAATLAATDSTGVAAMCLTFATTCTSWQAFSATPALTLPSGDGVKRLSVFLRDGRGNTTATPLTASTLLDTTAPTNGSVKATVSAGAVRLDWSGFSDAGSGLARYRVAQSTSATTDAAAACASGTVYEGTASTVSLAVPAKTTRRYRVCAIDVAGNLSTGATVSATTP
jgi:Subtilase family